MAARRMEIIGLLVCFCLCLIPCSARAASTAEARELISPDRECTLTISYCLDGTACPDLPVKLYQIADVSADFQYTLTDLFLSSRLALNTIRSAAEWNVVRSTLESYILANDIGTTLTALTDQEGIVCFDALKPGLYLAIAEPVAKEQGEYFFGSVLVALPGLGTDGLWQYQVPVTAKPEFLPPVEGDEEIQLKVLKLWKGDEGQGLRPQSIEVEIFRDGLSYQTVILSEENHWSYSWTAKADGADWMVVERNIPSEYSVTVEERAAAFILTNTLNPDEPPPGKETPETDAPKTGDTPNIMLYTVLMYVSGAVLLLLGITGKRKEA